jgi:AcrR family transcriptional regulator
MKKEQIIEAARILFHKYGFKKVSMDEIANEAGVTKKTIYMYFSSKEELLKYFILEEIEKMKDILEEVESKNTDFFETVNQAIYRLLKYKKEQNFLTTIEKEAEWLKNPVVIQNLKLIDEQIQDYIKEKLKVAKEKGYINYHDLDITAFLIYKMYIALMFEWNDNELDEQMIAKSISEILKNGLRKDV